MSAKQVRYLIDQSFFHYLKTKYIVSNELASAISRKDSNVKWLCRGGDNLITKYDRHNNIPFLATQLQIDFKMDSKGNIKQPCKLCEFVINKLKSNFYFSKHF